MIARADGPPMRPLLGRPSIRHLLLLMGTTGAAVWLMHAPAAATRVEGLIAVGCAPFYGVALWALLIAAIALGRGDAGVRVAAQPGHWLLFILGAGFGGVALFWRLLLVMEAMPHPPPQVFLPVMAGLFFAVFLMLVTAVLIFAALLEGVSEARWRAVFWLLAGIVPGPAACGCCLFAIVPSRGAFDVLMPVALLGIVAAMLIAAVLAAGLDLARRTPRDIWHWIGVACLFATVVHVSLLAIVVIPLQNARI